MLIYFLQQWHSNTRTVISSEVGVAIGYNRIILYLTINGKIPKRMTSIQDSLKNSNQ